MRIYQKKLNKIYLNYYQRNTIKMLIIYWYGMEEKHVHLEIQNAENVL